MMAETTIRITSDRNILKIHANLDPEHFLLVLSKFIGFTLVVASLLVKLPQILKIWKAKSGGKEVNLVEITLNLLSVTIYVSYSFVKGFPFITWGDKAFLAVQTLTIGILTLGYQGKLLKASSYLVVYMTISYILMSGIIPLQHLWILQGFNIVLSFTKKFWQILENHRNKNTGDLSAVTLFFMFFGSMARIFTVVQETRDVMALTSHSVSAFVNTILVFQVFYYWNVDIKMHPD